MCHAAGQSPLRSRRTAIAAGGIWTTKLILHSELRRLEKFQEDIPTSPEVIGVHTLNLKPNFKFSRLEFFFGGDPYPTSGVRYEGLVNL